MSYTKYHDPWVNADAATGGGDESTPLVAAALDHIEAGIAAAATVADAAIADVSHVTNGPLYWNGTAWVSDTLKNAQIASDAAIAYSKLNLASSIVNADVSASAAITQTKLASPPMALAKRTSALSITTATWTLLTLDGEDFDTDTIHSTSSNTHRLTCKTAGKYVFSLFVQWDSNTTGIRGMIAQKNSEDLPVAAGTGARRAGFAMTTPASGITLPMTAAGIVDLAVNDYLTAVVFQNSGGALNVAVDTYFAMWRIG